MKSKLQRGFTLVELVVVMIILAILGATVAPRLFDLSSSARFAALKGVYSSVSSASTMAHALQLAQGLSPGASVTVDSITINMSGGYPTTAIIGSAVVLDSSTFATNASGQFWVTGATNTANCSVTYTNGNPPTIVNNAGTSAANCS